MRVACVFIGFAALILAGCANDTASSSGRSKTMTFEREEQERAALLLQFDTDQNGEVSRAEMDAGISVEFAAADMDHDGKLNGDERRAVNERRATQGQNSPLLDWNSDGAIDMNEFASMWRTMFTKLDKDNDSEVSSSEFASIRIEDARAPRANVPPAYTTPTTSSHVPLPGETSQ